MQQISNEKKQEIIEALEEHGAKLPCPRCGNKSFTLLDGYFNQTIQSDLKGMVLGGPSVPSIVLVCTQCGYLSQHALGAIGLLPKFEEKIILENFKKASKLNFSILETEETQKIFPSYTEENPDFIINLDGDYIGVDLFMLCMTKSPTLIQYGGKKYINHMQRQSEHPNKVSSIEKLEEYIEKRKRNPEHYPLTRQDDPFDILKERLSQKAGKVKNYVTPKNWLLGFVDQFFNMGIVENIYDDQEVNSFQSLIRKIVGGIEKIDRVILFETGTGPTDKIFEYKNV